MGTTSTTRSIEVDAPVERVFAFLADPRESVRAFAMERTVTVSDIETSSEGAVKGYRESTPMRLVPVHWDVHDTVRVEEYVPNQHIVDRSSMELLHAWKVAPSETGTRLTFTGSVSTRIPLLDKVKAFVFTKGRGQARNMDLVLADMKQLVEAHPGNAEG